MLTAVKVIRFDILNCLASSKNIESNIQVSSKTFGTDWKMKKFEDLKQSRFFYFFDVLRSFSASVWSIFAAQPRKRNSRHPDDPWCEALSFSFPSGGPSGQIFGFIKKLCFPEVAKHSSPASSSGRPFGVKWSLWHHLWFFKVLFKFDVIFNSLVQIVDFILFFCTSRHSPTTWLFLKCFQKLRPKVEILSSINLLTSIFLIF